MDHYGHLEYLVLGSRKKQQKIDMTASKSKLILGQIYRAYIGFQRRENDILYENKKFFFSSHLGLNIQGRICPADVVLQEREK